jgi:hypothetical protein
LAADSGADSGALSGATSGASAHHIIGVFAADISVPSASPDPARIFWKNAPIRCFPDIFA